MRALPIIQPGQLNTAWGLAAFVDVETTGLSPNYDEIIEAAAVLFAFTRDTFEIMGVVDRFVGRQEPSVPISPFAQRVHGIRLEDLRGERLDLASLKRVVDQAEFIVAHNAGFDRSFLRRIIPEIDTKEWHCSLREIDWSGYGCESGRLRRLAADHGLIETKRYHRADDDCLLAINLLAQTGAEHTYLYEMMNATKIAGQKGRAERQKRAAARPTPGVLSGQTVVVTGEMARWSRAEIKDLIRSLGGRATSAVSKRTTLVVAGPGAGLKLTRARELGTRVIDEEEFVRLIQAD